MDLFLNKEKKIASSGSQMNIKEVKQRWAQVVH
jgi:hypothetical protein